jgi:RNase H-like domain found in reverse transcriptase
MTKTKGKTLVWNEARDKAFEAVKNSITKAGELRSPQEDKQYMLEADASYGALGAVLLQVDEEDGTWKPLGYYSEKLKSAERNYTTNKKGNAGSGERAGELEAPS